jgi:hypothetical protein
MKEFESVLGSEIIIPKVMMLQPFGQGYTT